MRLTLASMSLLALLGAAPTRAQLAVISTHDVDDATQGWLAGAVAAGATAHWQPLSPQLVPADLKRCGANEFRCFGEVAKQHGASHVLVVGVAPLGVRDTVVSAQLFAAGSERLLFEEAVVQAGDSGGADDGRSVVRELVARLVRVEGPPPAVPRPAPPAIEPAPPELGALSVAGLGVLGVGALGMGVTASVAAMQFSLGADYESATTTALAGTAASGVVLLGGVVLLVVGGL